MDDLMQESVKSPWEVLPPMALLGTLLTSAIKKDKG